MNLFGIILKISIKAFVGCILLAFISISSFAQSNAKAGSENGKKIVALDKSKVPKEVTDAYAKDFPGAIFKHWNGYPAANDEDWYYSDRYLYTHDEYPESYVVEFMKDNVPYSAFYTKSGKKIAVHRKLTVNLPKEISAAIFNSKYKTWKLGDKEEIFKDKEIDKSKVYKVGVEKGKEKHTLYFDSGGKLLKDKKES